MPLPDHVPFEIGAQLGIPGVTAAHCVLDGGDVSDQWILVHGDGGNVGYLAIHLAKWAGARVVATARAKDVDKCKRAGTDVVIDYRSATLAEDILDATSGAAMDPIIEVEFGQNIPVNVELIKPNGIICIYESQKVQTPKLHNYQLLFKAVTIDLVLIYMLEEHQRHTANTALTAALDERALDCPVDTIYPLTRMKTSATGRAPAPP